jgi:hypothetical protein
MEPDWKPLEEKLKPAQCAGFMLMGRLNGVNLYKHGLSRHHLNLGDDGRAYRYLERGRFEEIPFEEALAWVAEPLAEKGETLGDAVGRGVQSAPRGGLTRRRLGRTSSAYPARKNRNSITNPFRA